MLVATINDQNALDHPFAPFLEEAGFLRGGMGFYLRRPANMPEAPEPAGPEDLAAPEAPDEPDEPAPHA